MIKYGIVSRDQARKMPGNGLCQYGAPSRKNAHFRFFLREKDRTVDLHFNQKDGVESISMVQYCIYSRRRGDVKSMVN